MGWVRRLELVYKWKIWLQLKAQANQPYNERSVRAQTGDGYSKGIKVQMDLLMFFSSNEIRWIGTWCKVLRWEIGIEMSAEEWLNKWTREMQSFSRSVLRSYLMEDTWILRWLWIRHYCRHEHTWSSKCKLPECREPVLALLWMS